MYDLIGRYVRCYDRNDSADDTGRIFQMDAFSPIQLIMIRSLSSQLHARTNSCPKQFLLIGEPSEKAVGTKSHALEVQGLIST
jgi:hypothetical protein